MKKNKYQNKRITIILIIFVLVAFIILTFFNLNKNRNWQFYTENSIGPNNKFNIFDNLIFDDEAVIFNSQDKKTYSLDQKTGRINWIFSPENYSPFPPTITEEKIYLSNFDGNIYSLNKKTGYKVWQFNTDEQYQPDTPIVKSPTENIVYFGSRNGTLYALNSQTGQLIWEREFQKLATDKNFNDGTVHFGSIYVDNEQVFVFNSLENKLVALNQADGLVNWEINNILFSYESPLFFAETIVLKQNRYLLSINKSTGSYKKIERFGNSEVSWQFFKIENDNNYLMILDDHYLIKIDKNFENIAWSLNDIDNVLYSQKNFEVPIIKTKENQIFGQKFIRLNNTNHLLAINYESGEINWKEEVPSWIISHEFTDNTVFLGSNTGNIFAVNLNDKTMNWQSKLDGEPIKILLTKNNVISTNLKSSGKIAVTCLDQQSGQIIWSYTSDFIVNKNDIYINNETIYILNKDNKIVQKINTDLNNPNENKIKKINFFYEEIKDFKNPYVVPKKITPISWWLKQKYLKISYLIKNVKNIFLFDISQEFKQNVVKISIKHDENFYSNKFLDLKIDAVFHQKDDENEIKINGFYYDHNTWKIIFSAPKTGEYQYQINIKNNLINKKIKGSVFLNNDQKEEIIVNQDSFTINNEKMFFPIGIQDAFVDRNYNGNLMDMMPNSATIEPVVDVVNYSYLNLDNYLDLYKKEANLNIFRYGVDHWTLPLWYSYDPKNIIFSINGGKFGDSLIDKLKNRNFKIIMTIFGFYPPYISEEEITKKENQETLKIYLDYVIARFSPYIDLWELSNEAEAHYLWYDFVIDYLKENDPYHHPVSTNWETESAKNLDFLSVHWYNPNLTDPGTLSNQIGYLKQKYQNTDQAIFVSELGFKNYSHFQDSSESMRMLTWLSIFQKMGIVFWTQGQNGIYKNLNNANIYLGPVERSYLLTLSNFLPKDMYLPVNSKLIFIHDLQVQAYLLENNDFILAYLLKMDESLKKQDYLNLNLANNANLQWIEPKTGKIIEEKLIEKGQQRILIPNFNIDLAMKISYL